MPAQVLPIKSIYDLLNLPRPDESGVADIAATEKESPPQSLPVAGDGEAPPEKAKPIAPAVETADLPKVRYKSFLRQYDIPTYAVLFLISFTVFYLIFNWEGIGAQLSGWLNLSGKTEEEVVLGDEGAAAYQQWIYGYFFQVNDQARIAPNEDYDRDGRTNIEEYRAGTNPTISDNPRQDGGSNITPLAHAAGRKELVANSQPALGGMSGNASPRPAASPGVDVSPVRPSTFSPTTQSAQGSSAARQQLPPSFTLPASPLVAGSMRIPKLGVHAPIVWVKDAKDFEAAMENGIAHYPTTALPGEKGTGYYVGHSSDYVWKRNSKFRTIFAKLNHLNPGDEILIDAEYGNGEKTSFRYIATEEKVYSPKDPAQFANVFGKSAIRVCTSWPVGTTKSRYCVTAELRDTR